MTDPTPTRDEVEIDALIRSFHHNSNVGKALVSIKAENQALRERAEAAESRCEELEGANIVNRAAIRMQQAKREAAECAEAAAWQAGETLNKACDALFDGMTVDTLEQFVFKGNMNEVLQKIGAARAPFGPFAPKSATSPNKAWNEALEKAIAIARRCGAFATARDIRKLLRVDE